MVKWFLPGLTMTSQEAPFRFQDSASAAFWRWNSSLSCSPTARINGTPGRGANPVALMRAASAAVSFGAWFSPPRT